MTELENLLQAGAILAMDTDGAFDRSKIDAISARRYQHPALNEPVVRLSADSLAEGDDLAMEYLGFGGPEVEGPMGCAARQALGFPAWALIHDPDHAGFALDVVKDMKREQRRAKSKPGHALDGYTEIAKRLGRSVAHFLPSFWEEAGRTFLQLGNANYASRAFNKAREAERVHALKVDEDLRRDVFLEFALGGALAIKTVSQYGKELLEQLEPEHAWQLFRELCLRRTLGGMPPWATMHRDLERMLDATDLDKQHALEEFLGELLESPAIANAPEGFWKGVKSHVKSLVTQRADLAGKLLNLFPPTSVVSPQSWLTLLDEWGILPHVWENVEDEQAGPQGGVTAWVARALSHQYQVCPALMAMLPQAAAKLRESGVPLSVVAKAYRAPVIDLDALDLLLELQAPIEDPPPDATFWLARQWASPMDGAVDQPRDPIHVVQDQRFGEVLERAVEVAAGDEAFRQAAAGMAGMAAARKAWLLTQIANVQTGAVANAALSIADLDAKTDRDVFAEFPEALERLKEVDLTGPLQRTLQFGLLDEYGWPALEEAAESLDPEGKATLQFWGSFPFVVVHNDAVALVVEHDQQTLRHELRQPKGAALEGFVYVDGQLAVYYRLKGQLHVYWSSDPGSPRPLEGHRIGSNFGGAVLALDGGGVFIGSGAFFAGDTSTRPEMSLGYFDGEHYWRRDRDKDYNVVLREWSPQDGDGRRSLPSFLEDYVQDGGDVIVNDSYLLTYGEPVAESPLGAVDGQIGLRVKVAGDQRFTEDMAGRSWQSGTRQFPHPNAFLNQVAGDAVFLVASRRIDNLNRYNDEIRLLCPEGKAILALLSSSDRSYNRGQAAHLPVIFWHHFRPRDVENSRRLRNISADDTRALLDAASADREAAGAWGDEAIKAQPQLTAALDERFPQLNERLRAGLKGVVDRAAAVVASLGQLIEQRDPAHEPPANEMHGNDVKQACAALLIRGEWRADYAMLLPQIRNFRAWLADEGRANSIPACPVQWHVLLSGLDARLWRMLWESGNDDDSAGQLITLEDRQLALQFAEIVVQQGFETLPGKLRVLQVQSNRDHAAIKRHNDRKIKAAAAFEAEGNKFLVLEDSYRYSHLLEYSPTGKFSCPQGFKFESETILLPGAPPASSLLTLIDLIRTRPRPQLDEEQLTQLAGQLDGNRALAALLWMGGAFTQRSYKNFLPKSLRTAYKLKVNEAEVAKNVFTSLDQPRIRGAISAMLAQNPWDAMDEALAELASAFRADAAPTVQLPGPVYSELEELTRDMWVDYWSSGPTMTLPDYLEMVAVAPDHPLLQSDPKLRPAAERYSVALETVDGEPCFTHKHLRAAVRTMVLLYDRLPVGHPALKTLPDFYLAVKERLEKPNLYLELGSVSYYDGSTEELMAKLLGKPKADGDLWTINKQDRWLIGSDRRLLAAVRAKSLADVDSFRELRTWADSLAAIEGFDATGVLLQFAFFGSTGLWEMMKRIVRPELPDGSWEQNPQLSVPDVLEQVQSKYALTPAGAAHYLQLLALPNPSDKLVKVWNDWKPAALRRAGGELVEQGLVLEAKRSRAGRKWFLPGGWEALKSPHAPIERWKLPLFKVHRHSGTDKLHFPLGRILSAEPMWALFTRAWQRILDGDPPQYEEV